MRTFVAVELSAEAKRQLAGVQALLQPHGPSLKFVTPEVMHMTLRFLGELPPERVTVVQDATATATRRVQPFTLQLSLPGSFPTGGRMPRVIWVGLERDAGYAALQGLFATLQDELEKNGFGRESKELAPHLTLARVRQGQSSDDLRALATTVQRLSRDLPLDACFPVRHITVFKSDLSASGSQYTALSRPVLGSPSTASGPSRRRTPCSTPRNGGLKP